MKKQLVFKKNVTLIERTHFILLILIRVSLIVAIVSSIYNFSWAVLFVSVFTFVLTFLPYFYERKYKIDIPIELELITVIFIYASLFLGEIRNYYTFFWWWDVVLHAGAAVALGFIGFMILFVLHRGDKIRASPRAIAVFSFFFAVGIGALWEIFEFFVDSSFGLNMQRSGLRDTMWDLIIDSVGALVVSLCGYFYLKRGEFLIVDKIIKRFVMDNPELFEKR